jgi:hypothetical protein
MQLTPVFNDAAQGGAGHMPVDGGPQSPKPSDPAAAQTPLQAANEQTNATDATARQFEAVLEPPQPNAPNQLSDDIRAEKEANLKTLELGRAKPQVAHNLKPSPQVEKAVHQMHEGWREKFIRELQSELAVVDNLDETYVLDEGFDEDFGPSF